MSESTRTDAAALSARLVRSLRSDSCSNQTWEGSCRDRKLEYQCRGCEADEAADTIDRLTRERDTLRRALEQQAAKWRTIARSRTASEDERIALRGCAADIGLLLRPLPEPREPEAARTEPT